MNWLIKKTLIFIFSFTIIHVFAQVENKPIASNTILGKTHEKKSFIGAEGDIYWNLEMPVYLSISSDPNGKNAQVLEGMKSDVMREHVNPMYFDGSGVHYIRHLDYHNQLPENEVAFEVFVDGIKPITSTSFLEASKYINSGKVYYGKKLSTSLAAKDELSGIDKIYYSVGTGEFMNYSNAINFDKEGEFTISYYALDNVGNVEDAKSKNFTVDLTAPKTEIVLTGDKLGEVISPKIEIALKPNDAVAGVKKTFFQFDDNKELVYNNVFNPGLLTDGEHTITYYSVDNVMNNEEPKKYSFYLDKIAPEITSEIIGDVHRINGKTFIAGKTKIKLNGSDNKAGVENIFYSINGRAQQQYSSEFVMDESQGAYKIVFWGVDKVKNKSIGKVDADMGSLYLDITSPKISHTYTGPKFYSRDTMFITSDTKFNLKGTDLQSGMNKVTYKVDGASEKTYDSPFTLDLNGYHTLYYEGVDMVSNTSKDDFFFIIDNEAPEIFSHLSINKIATQKIESTGKEIPVYPKHAMLYLAATDKQVGTDKLYYTVDGEIEKEYLGPIKTTRTGLWKVIIRATDKLGNSRNSDPIEFVIQ